MYIICSTSFLILSEYICIVTIVEKHCNYLIRLNRKDIILTLSTLYPLSYSEEYYRHLPTITSLVMDCVSGLIAYTSCIYDKLLKLTFLIHKLPFNMFLVVVVEGNWKASPENYIQLSEITIFFEFPSILIPS